MARVLFMGLSGPAMPASGRSGRIIAWMPGQGKHRPATYSMRLISGCLYDRIGPVVVRDLSRCQCGESSFGVKNGTEAPTMNGCVQGGACLSCAIHRAVSAASRVFGIKRR